jgi:hypothetical protein
MNKFNQFISLFLDFRCTISLDFIDILSTVNFSWLSVKLIMCIDNMKEATYSIKIAVLSKILSFIHGNEEP